MESDLPDKPYLNVRETAALLGVHENTIRNWVSAGTIISSRLPGATAHRFAREEVLRLLKTKGQPTSSVAPILRTSGPELVSANELNGWASREDAKGGFPELMRRLLALTPGITNLEVRAREGAAAPGWDGRATSSGSAYLPAGELRFEFGTDGNPKAKAQSDYENRLKELPKEATSTFVFATPRNWPGASSWASERTEEKKFAGGVKALDAHMLEGWLQATPSVHYWISERLGYLPRNAQTLERWWSAFQGRTLTPLPSGFFAAGRQAESEKLRTLLAEPTNDRTITIQAPWKEEALAFIFTVLEPEDDLLYRAIVVSDPAVWERLVDSSVPLILIPVFGQQDGNDVNLQAAVQKGHRVVLVADSSDVVRGDDNIVLRKVERTTASEALRAQGVESSKADAMVALGRRSMPALIRSIGREPRFRAPAWVTDVDQASVLAPLLLAGSWTARAGDQHLLEELTGRTADEIERLLRTLANRPDAPYVFSGGVWRLASPAEAALLLLPRLTANDIARWRDAVPKVMFEPDPFRGMDAVARLTASATGTSPTYSEALKKALANSLALVAVSNVELSGGQPSQAFVDGIVSQLLASANADRTGAKWHDLSRVLPELAEASPEVFLDAIELDLSQSDPILRTLFQDSGSDAFFGPSSPHPSLLWAIEALCWSPTYFGRAAMLLARIATLDPGGRLSNRPIESLQNVSLGWIQQSGASGDDKIAIIRRLLGSLPAIGWKLAMGVWPSHHSIAMGPHAPIYRDWSPVGRSVTISDWGRFIHELVMVTLDAAGTNFELWQELIPKMDELPSAERQVVVAKLGDVLDTQQWSDDERYAVWEALTSEADRHEEYSSSEWAMPAPDVALYRDLASKITPESDARQYSNLFDWRARVSGLKLGDEGYNDQLARLQREGLSDVMLLGWDKVRSLVLDVKTPHVVGRLLAERDDFPEDEIFDWLGSGETNLVQAALSFSYNRIEAHGFSWLTSALSHPSLQGEAAREVIMAAVPSSRQYWVEVESLPAELFTAYWQRLRDFDVPRDERPEAVGLLLEHGRPWEAISLLSHALHDQQQVEIDLVKQAFGVLLVAVEPAPDPTMSGYYVGNLLTYMEAHAPDDTELPKYEFMFFELVHDHEPSAALYRALCKDPADFVNFIRSIFRSENESERTQTPQEASFARLAMSVLREWRLLPGQSDDGKIDAVALTEWVRAARLALSDSGHTAIGDEYIGQILAGSPVGDDGIWPAEAVRELIETIGNIRIDTGVQIGKTNRRGVTTRGMFVGGDQEHALEGTYRETAAKIATQWPRTARILRGIADYYQREARRHDEQAERLSDDG